MAPFILFFLCSTSKKSRDNPKEECGRVTTCHCFFDLSLPPPPKASRQRRGALLIKSTIHWVEIIRRIHDWQNYTRDQSRSGDLRRQWVRVALFLVF
jgi:hypothetical protein